PGVAAAETIKAGDKGGKQAGFLGMGILLGAGGTFLGIPMSAAGISFIANIFAMLAFGSGLVISGYSLGLFNYDFNENYVAHGIMIGAGLVALTKFIIILSKDLKKNKEMLDSSEGNGEESEFEYTRTSKQVGKAFGIGYVAYIIGAT